MFNLQHDRRGSRILSLNEFFLKQLFPKRIKTKIYHFLHRIFPKRIFSQTVTIFGIIFPNGLFFKHYLTNIAFGFAYIEKLSLKLLQRYISCIRKEITITIPGHYILNRQYHLWKWYILEQYFLPMNMMWSFFKLTGKSSYISSKQVWGFENQPVRVTPPPL